LPPPTTIALLGSLGDGLHRTRISLDLMDSQRRLGRFYTLALDRATDRNTPLPQRLDAVRLLGASPFTFTDTGDVLLLLLGSGEPHALQSAVLAAIGRFNDPRVTSSLLARFSLLGPALRDQAISALLTRADRIPAVVGALDSRALPVTELSSIQLNFLRTIREAITRTRVLQMFGPVTTKRPEVVEKYQPALK